MDLGVLKYLLMKDHPKSFGKFCIFSGMVLAPVFVRFREFLSSNCMTVILMQNLILLRLFFLHECNLGKGQRILMKLGRLVPLGTYGQIVKSVKSYFEKGAGYLHRPVGVNRR
jgi:hypothetical protein